MHLRLTGTVLQQQGSAVDGRDAQLDKRAARHVQHVGGTRRQELLRGVQHRPINAKPQADDAEHARGKPSVMQRTAEPHWALSVEGAVVSGAANGVERKHKERLRGAVCAVHGLLGNHGVQGSCVDVVLLQGSLL